MVAVYIGTFDKKINSTARPDTSQFSQYNCEIKANTSMSNPTLIIATGNLVFNHGSNNWNNPGVGEINYCYIPLWQRYYFIRDISFGAPNSEIICTIDVLATYKTNIGSSSQYVLRCATATYIDGSLIDNYYPTKTGVDVDTYSIVNKPFSTLENSSTWYSIGIITQGGTQFYLMNYATLNDFLHYLLSDGFASATLQTLGVTLLGKEQSKLLVDPLQYITAGYIIPFDVMDYILTPDIESVDTVPVGYTAYTRPSDKVIYRIIDPIIHIVFTVSTENFPHHPQVARGTYLDRAPYTQSQLFLPGYGLIAVDANEMRSFPTYAINYDIDMRTGAAMITTGNYVTTFNKTSANLLVPIPFSQVQARGIGALDVANVVNNTFGGISITNPFSTITSMTSSLTNFVGDAVKNMIPHARNVGAYGSFADLYGDIELFFTFYSVADNDITNEGAPCCKVLKISNLSGFISCMNTHIVLSGATKSETEQVINYMNGGFYYE